MADLFEQIVADYLTERGYLTKLNVNYRKYDGKGSGSDIDVLALHQKSHKVIVGECKSWQSGINFDWMITSETKGAKDTQDYFKPIFQDDWAKGLVDKVNEEFGTREFVYTIFCARTYGSSEKFVERTIDGNRIEILRLSDIVRETVQRIRDKKNQSVEPTTLGRFLQLQLAAGISLAADSSREEHSKNRK